MLYPCCIYNWEYDWCDRNAAGESCVVPYEDYAGYYREALDDWLWNYCPDGIDACLDACNADAE